MVKKWFFLTVFCFTILGITCQAVPSYASFIDFVVAPTYNANAEIKFDGSILTGTELNVPLITSQGSPLNPGGSFNPQTLIGMGTYDRTVLSFTANNYLGNWKFGGGTIRIDSYDTVGNQFNLMTGTLTNAEILWIGSSLKISAGSFSDHKNDQLAQFFGYPTGMPWTGDFGVQFTTSVIPYNTFDVKNPYIQSGNVSNTVPIPGAAWLLGSGLLGLLGLRRKIIG